MSASDPTDIVPIAAPGGAEAPRGDGERGRRRRRGAPARDRPLPESWLREIEIVRYGVGWFGTHLICPRSGCRRAGRCTDVGEPRFPACFRLYRGEIRYAIQLVGAYHGLKGQWHDGEIRPHRGLTFLGALAAAGAPIGNLRRPRDCRRAEWAWESDPEAKARLDELRAEAAARRQGAAASDAA